MEQYFRNATGWHERRQSLRRWALWADVNQVSDSCPWLCGNVWLGSPTNPRSRTTNLQPTHITRTNHKPPSRLMTLATSSWAIFSTYSAFWISTFKEDYCTDLQINYGSVWVVLSKLFLYGIDGMLRWMRRRHCSGPKISGTLFPWKEQEVHDRQGASYMRVGRHKCEDAPPATNPWVSLKPQIQALATSDSCLSVQWVPDREIDCHRRGGES